MGLLSNFFRNKNKYNTTILAINIAPWKRELFNNLYANSNIVYVPLKADLYSYKKYINNSKKVEILIWGYKECINVEQFAKDYKVPIVRVEDGFLRSLGLGIDKVLPMSLCFDRTGLYYNAEVLSDFEQIANHKEQFITSEILTKAKEFREGFVQNSITKYNLDNLKDFSYPTKTKERVLVIGQVESDWSIKKSMSKITTNLELLKFAKKENPNCEIVFKQHPDDIYSKSNIDHLKNLCDICIDFNIELNSLLDSVDKVYTISSLLGFESVIRGIEVHTTGLPFYAGWGLTCDSISTPRRKIKLSIDELFAITYLIYPIYIDQQFQKKPSIEFISSFIELCKERNLKKLVANKELNIKRTNIKANIEKNVPKQDESDDKHELPDFLHLRNSVEINIALQQHKPVFLYVPWIFGHTETLMADLQSKEYILVALNMVDSLDSSLRIKLSAFTQKKPILYRNYIRSRLVDLKDKIEAVIVTFDWAPITRTVVDVCHELNIYTVLIPHESIFLNRDLYYKHLPTNASVPICDEALVWGNAQFNVFLERGYPLNRIFRVGSPKLDRCINYIPMLTHLQFCRFYGLKSDKPVILFACQNLDIQINTALANKAQNQAIKDIIEYCKNTGAQAIFRLPPSATSPIFDSTKRIIDQTEGCIIDVAPLYLTNPVESICHSNIVVSINSTMLLEAALMKKNTLSIRYVDGINSIWHEELIPNSFTSAQTMDLLNKLLYTQYELSNECLNEINRLAQEFGIGTFDGKASQRIRERLTSIVTNKDKLTITNYKDMFFDMQRMDVMKIASSPNILNSVQRHIKELLNVNSLLNSKNNDERELSAVQLFVQWGIAINKAKQIQLEQAKKLGKDILFIEDGFIRSCNIGLSGEPTLSIIYDDLSAYYDATSQTRLEKILTAKDFRLTKEQEQYARFIIDKIVSNQVSKYNTAPLRHYKIGRPKHKKLLLVDQRFNDMSVMKGNGSEQIFDQMLTDAINNYSDWDIVIKQHPDALIGGKSSYYSEEKLKFPQTQDNVFIINQDMNPFCLLAEIDEVFVCTSGMGFEALLAGKKVTCYGMPWYAGYGITKDLQRVERRNVNRKLEDLFYVAYIELSRYFNPDTNSLCPIEDLIEYIVLNRSNTTMNGIN